MYIYPLVFVCGKRVRAVGVPLCFSDHSKNHTFNSSEFNLKIVSQHSQIRRYRTVSLDKLN